MSEANEEFLERMKRKAYNKMVFLAVQVDMPDLKRLIEQAERAQELEKEVNGLHWRNEWLKSEEEIERLGEALETIEIMTKDARNRREDYRRVARKALEVSE